MKDKRPVRIILKDQAKLEFEELNKIVGEQQAKGITNSEEIQLIINYPDIEKGRFYIIRNF